MCIPIPIMAYVVKHVSIVATALAIAGSEWKREVDKAIGPYRVFKNIHGDSSKTEWFMYSGRLGIENNAALVVWDSKGNPTYGVPNRPE